MKIGFIGLGHMGLNMVENLIDDGHEIIAWNRSTGPKDAAKDYGATVVENIKDIPRHLDAPKIIFSMISAGPIIDKILFDNGENSIANILNPGDIFIDGVNSYYKDSIKRAKKLKEKGTYMVDAGISGGVYGARHGACSMVGCPKEIWQIVEPIFKDLSTKDGYARFGNNGTGHFVKMVHNAIEYGMMQVIGEGINLIDSAEEFNPNLGKLLEVWSHGSIIEGNLLSFLKLAIDKEDIHSVEPEIGSLGTGRWAAEDALQRGVPFTAISHAVFNRYTSRGAANTAFEVIQAMRNIFGSHTSKERASQ